MAREWRTEDVLARAGAGMVAGAPLLAAVTAVLHWSEHGTGLFEAAGWGWFWACLLGGFTLMIGVRWGRVRAGAAPEPEGGWEHVVHLAPVTVLVSLIAGGGVLLASDAAGPGDLSPTELRMGIVAHDEERGSDGERYHRVRILDEEGQGSGSRELPGPVEELEAAPDGWSVVVRYGGDEPGSLAFRGRGGDVIAEDLPTGETGTEGHPARVAPVDGERLLYTEADEGARQVEYRLEKPVVGVPGGLVPETETLGSLTFRFTDELSPEEAVQALDPGAVAVGPELFAAVHGGDREPVDVPGARGVHLLVGEWGSGTTVIPLDTDVEGLSPDGSPFGVALAPEAVVVSGFSVGDRAHVVGAGPAGGR